MPDKERASVDADAEAATAEYYRRSSLTFLECCISLMLTHLSTEQVAEILRAEAQQLEEFG